MEKSGKLCPLLFLSQTLLQAGSIQSKAGFLKIHEFYQPSSSRYEKADEWGSSIVSLYNAYQERSML
jgi:hypothetical protein